MSKKCESLNFASKIDYEWWCAFILYQYKTCWRNDTQFWIDHKNVKCDFYDKIIDMMHYVPTQNHIYHEFHTDRKVPHRVALFYVTTSNGFTVLKDTTKVECVENHMLLFDGSIEHCSVTSTDHPRCIINFNFN